MVKVVVSDPETGKAYQLEPEESRESRLWGLGIGDTFDGGLLDLSDYKLRITGGMDCDGLPMRFDVEGTGRKRILLAEKPCFKPRRKGERRRKLVRGRIASNKIVQLNVKVVEWGDKPLEEILGLEPIKEDTEEGR